MNQATLPVLQPSSPVVGHDSTRASPTCCGSHVTQATESPWVWARLVLSIYLTGLAMTVALVLNTTDDIGASVRWWMQAFLIGITVAVWTLLGMNFVSGAWHAAKKRRAALEMLIFLAMLGALGYSIASVIRGSGAVYFEVVCVLLIVYSLGQRLKNRVRESVTSQIDARGATGLTANRVTEEQIVESVLVSEVRRGQHVVVYPGQMIPVDGIVRSGTALVREAALTGESVAVPRGPGQSVSAATICLDAALTIQTTRDGDDRLIDHIHRAVQAARQSPSSVESSAQRIAGWFLPVVVTVAGLTFAYWSWKGHLDDGLLNAAAVLLVACPCALGLATPIAVWAALSQAAKLGLVCKHGDAVLSLAEVDYVCFDKTGTLTAGEAYSPQFDVMDDANWTLDEIKTIVATVERTSDHPYAVALRDAAVSDPRFRVLDVDLLAGRGIAAVLADRVMQRSVDVQIVTSTASFAGNASQQVVRSSPAGTQLLTSSAARPGTTAQLDVLLDDQLVAHVELAESIPIDLVEMFTAFRAAGIQTAVLSGDAQSRVDVLPADVQRGGLSSFQKSEIVAELKQNRHVLFVGDGFNDAQAMAVADVSIAAAWGTDFAAETADIVWTRRDFASLVAAIRMSRRVSATIRSNLIFAATYNTVGMSLAATGWLNPIAAALLMLASSLTVTLRASHGAGN